MLRLRRTLNAYKAVQAAHTNVAATASTTNVIWKRWMALHSSIQSRIEWMQQRHQELSTTLSTNDGSLSSDDLTKFSIEMAELEPKVTAANDLQQKQSTIEELDEILDDDSKDADSVELRKMAQDERRELVSEIEELEDTVTRLMLPKDENDEKSCILEIRAGTGGDEASLFASELLQMYQKVAAAHSWSFSILSLSTNPINGGAKEAICELSGHSVYGQLKFESGVHRVQRVPVNDIRIHTSTVSVAVLPQAPEGKDETLDMKDVNIDVFRASGAGGQHVNTTESAVRATHLPTGLQASVQDERSQHQNKAKALRILSARVADAQRQEELEKEKQMRSSQIGTGGRSERIRTYNFPQDRVSDHRINFSITGIDKVMGGSSFEDFADKLIIQEQNEKLEQLEGGFLQ